MQKNKRVVIKEELVKLTQNRDKAVILNQFLYWTPRTSDYSKFVKEEAGDTGVTDYGWIFKTAEELMEELLMIDINVKTVRKYLDNLVDNGYLLRRRNPVKKYDKTYQYRINLKLLVEELNKIGYKLEGFEQCVPTSNIVNGQIGSSKVTFNPMEDDKTDVGKSKITSAIPKITNKEYNSNNEIKKETGDSVEDMSFKKVKELYLKLSIHNYLVTKDERAIISLLSTGVKAETVLTLMNECYKTALKLKKEPVIKSFAYFKNFIEGTLKEQKVSKEIINTNQSKVTFVGDTTADF